MIGKLQLPFCFNLKNEMQENPVFGGKSRAVILFQTMWAMPACQSLF